MPMIHHPGFGGSVNYSPLVLSDDPDEQVEQTIALMSQYALEDSRTLPIQAEARQALAASPGATPEEAVFNWVRSRTTFLPDDATAAPLRLDPPVVEVLIRPVDLAAMCSGSGCRRAGDCDDYSMYGASLLMALGRPVSFVTVAADPVAPDRFSHVYLASYPNGERIPLDISHGPAVGWETPNYSRRKEWPVTGAPGLGLLLLAAGAAYYLSQRGVI